MLALPDALDRMTICVDAGLGFEAALQKVSAQWDNELGLEFRRVIGEMRLGYRASTRCIIWSTAQACQR